MQINRRLMMLPATDKPEEKKDPKKTLSFSHLDHIWKAPLLSTIREDWLLWMDTLRLECLKNSPANSLNCCSRLAESHSPLAKELFHATFMSIWTHLTQQQQDNIALNFTEALKNCPYIEPIQTILNLAEFMDHSEKGPLPVNYPLLSKSASQVQAYAKALRYKELELWERTTDFLDSNLSHMHAASIDCQQILSYAKKLNLEELALGVITYAKRLNMDVSGKWHEKLGQWETALQSYEIEMSTAQNLTDYNMLDFKLRQMRCLEQLFEWKKLNEITTEYLAKNWKLEEYSGQSDVTERKQKILQIAARASWTAQDWKKMSEITSKLNENTVEGAFLRAVVAVKEENYPQALNYINKVRDTFDSELTAMAAESYERAYGAIVMAQHLTELEEAIEYKMIPERRTRIAVVWSRRLQGISLDVDQWHKSLIVRQLVMSKK
jgi:FKBP12-rapamycin complex-associated protein